MQISDVINLMSSMSWHRKAEPDWTLLFVLDTLQPVVTQEEGEVRLVPWSAQHRLLLCRNGSGGGVAGCVGLQHATRGDDVRLKVLQGEPCISR